MKTLDRWQREEEKAGAIYTSGTFYPVSSHAPGQKDLLSRLVARAGTKDPTFCPGAQHCPGQKGTFLGPSHDPGLKVLLAGRENFGPFSPRPWLHRGLKGPYSFTSRHFQGALLFYTYLFYLNAKTLLFFQKIVLLGIIFLKK